MTLIIGIKCRDGIVIGSDGAATLGSMGANTVTQPTKKLTVLKDKIIVGVSGPVGLGQRLKGVMNNIWDQNLLNNKEPYEAMTIISSKFREHINPELEAARVAGATIGNLALQAAICTSVVAVPVKKVPRLFQFDQQGAPEETTEELPYLSIGSGQGIADPFLGFIRKVLWSNGCPTLEEGVFATLWTLEHAISITPGGVSHPVQIMSLARHTEGSELIAKEYTELELEEHKEAIKAVENSIKNFRSSITNPESTVQIPEVAAAE